MVRQMRHRCSSDSQRGDVVIWFRPYLANGCRPRGHGLLDNSKGASASRRCPLWLLDNRQRTNAACHSMKHPNRARTSPSYLISVIGTSAKWMTFVVTEPISKP